MSLKPFALANILTGLMFLVTACSALFVGIQVMFEVRETEMRKGIFLRC